MSVSAVTSTSTTYSTSSTSSSSSSLSQSDFLTLLVEQLQNQNPLEPTSTDKILDQMMSYANYSEQSEISDTLSAISTKLDAVVSGLDITV